MLDRRRTKRVRAYKGVRIEFNTHWPAVEALVRNQSETGAFVELPDDISMPLEFSLVFTQANETRHCRQVWRKGKQVGVAFV